MVQLVKLPNSSSRLQKLLLPCSYVIGNCIGALDFWYTHAMISDEAHAAIHEYCDFSVIGPLMRGRAAVMMGPGGERVMQNNSSREVSVIDDLQ